MPGRKVVFTGRGEEKKATVCGRRVFSDCKKSLASKARSLTVTATVSHFTEKAGVITLGGVSIQLYKGDCSEEDVPA